MLRAPPARTEASYKLWMAEERETRPARAYRGPRPGFRNCPHEASGRNLILWHWLAYHAGRLDRPEWPIGQPAVQMRYLVSKDERAAAKACAGQWRW